MEQYFYIHLALTTLLSLYHSCCYAHTSTKNINATFENDYFNTSIQKQSDSDEKSSENAKRRGLKEGHIVGGSMVNIQEFPFIVSIHIFGVHHCGGSLIRTNWVLTAAHCRNRNARYDDYWIWAGENDAGARYLSNTAQVIQGRGIVWNTDYSADEYFYNDIAMIQTVRSFRLTPSVQLINLATYRENNNRDVTKLSDYGTVIGWGDTRQQRYGMRQPLRYVSIPLISWDRCRWNWAISWGQMCAMYQPGGRADCFGDSGGPLVWWWYGEYLQQGIVSYSVGCARRGVPNVYTRVDQYTDWINWNLDRYRKGEDKCSRMETTILPLILVIATYMLQY